MPMSRAQFFGILAVSYVAATLGALGLQFYAERCPAHLQRGSCLAPALAAGDEVDVFCFVSTSAAFCRVSRALLLWNATGVPYESGSVNSSVTLPLSQPALAGVRGGAAQLHAHCFLHRAGRGRPADPGRGALLSASARITRPQRVVYQERRNLVAPAPNASLFSGPEVSPMDGLVWSAGAAAATGFFEPSPALAAARHGVVAGAVPWLAQKAADERERAERQRQKERRAREERPPEPQGEVPHLVPSLRFLVTVDEALYHPQRPAPLVFQDAHGRATRYTTAAAGQSRAPRYLPMGEVDNKTFRHGAWLPLSANTSTPDPTLRAQVDFDGAVSYGVRRTFHEVSTVYTQMGLSEQDLDMVRDHFFRYPLHILAAQQLIGWLQMWLSAMAFKNDVSFFRGRSDYTGLSSRSMATDTLHEVVIFLYLYDFDDVSRLLLFQLGISSAISLWKFAKVARLRVYWKWLLPWVAWDRGAVAGAKERATDELDARGMRALKWVLYPLSAVWGLYNLYHYSYKSWWSWAISSCADFAYSFGFVNMMPQIFINYKLKSVAHMPWRVLMYKFFHTFIDDVYAFWLMGDYMTRKHRWMTLRDDAVFFIFLYQRWLYPVDGSRPDEYGYVYGVAPSPAEGSDPQPADAPPPPAGGGAADAAGEGCGAAAPTARVSPQPPGADEPPS
eukprot:TRINITY_DN21109_c0_g1_i1.p1 TRINITY_DN21109_c0_g1~~TRINITY_DN21109_c0_g1_i1.p1  ORF type:complete len:699 (+),score=239.50 TRINITY_DN21109_c0_g1_i1:73-2097(+)